MQTDNEVMHWVALRNAVRYLLVVEHTSHTESDIDNIIVLATSDLREYLRPYYPTELVNAVREMIAI